MKIEKSNTYTFTTTDDCLHNNYTFRKVTVNFYLFELTMLFKGGFETQNITL
jgi:hypothetical protein